MESFLWSQKNIHPEALLSWRPASKYGILYFGVGQGFINIGAPVHIISQWFPLDSAEEANMNMNSLPRPNCRHLRRMNYILFLLQAFQALMLQCSTAPEGRTLVARAGPSCSGPTTSRSRCPGVSSTTTMSPSCRTSAQGE